MVKRGSSQLQNSGEIFPRKKLERLLTKHAIPVLVNGLTSVDASMKNVCHKPKSGSQQNEHKIIIIGDSHARGSGK
jgi:hypothetical protein